MSKASSMSATVAVPALLALASAGGAQTNPTASAGPILCFQIRSDGESGVAHWLFELDATAPPRMFWRTGGNAAAIARLDRTHVLCASYGDPYALLTVDLDTGVVREIAPGVPHSFVAQHGDDVLYIGDDRHGKDDDHLYAVPWRAAGERVRVAGAHFARVPSVVGNVAVGIERGDAAVWVVSLAGGAHRRVWTLPAGADRVRVALSPGGQRLAIGCVDADGTGRLAVVDSGSAIVREWSGLRVDVSPCSSYLPTLEVAWRDDDHVVCSETRGDALAATGSFVRVERRVARDEPSTEAPYGPIGLWHSLPVAPPPSPVFEITRDGPVAVLRRVGSDVVLARADERKHAPEHLVASPDGAAATSHTVRGVLLFTRNSTSPRRLPSGAHALAWLPAAR